MTPEDLESVRDAIAEQGRNSSLWRAKYLIPGMLAILTGGTFLGFQLVRVEDPYKIINDRVYMLGVRSVAQEVQMVEGIRYISDKIDKAHPEVADEVKKPPSLERAEARVEDIKRQKAVAEIFTNVPNIHKPLERLNGD